MPNDAEAERADPLAAIRNAMERAAALGPPPFMASHSLLPQDSGVRFEKDGRTYFAAHPAMWAQLPAAEIAADPIRPANSIPFFGHPIVDLDKDSEARVEFYGAMSEAMRGDHKQGVGHGTCRNGRNAR